MCIRDRFLVVRSFFILPIHSVKALSLICPARNSCRFCLSKNCSTELGDVLYWDANFAKLFMKFCCFSGTIVMRISGDGYLLHNVFKCWLLHSSWADTKQQNRKHNENNNFEFCILINKSLFIYVISFLQTSISSFQLHLLIKWIFRMRLFTAYWFIKLI